MESDGGRRHRPAPPPAAGRDATTGEQCALAHYDIDPQRSTVWIDATSSVHPIHSRGRGLTGFLDVEVDRSGVLDLTGAPAGHLELPVDAMSSGNPLYDREMRRRVEARAHPTISGELAGIELPPGAADHLYRERGDVTFKGVTRRYEDVMSIVADDDVLVLEGHHVFDVRDFGFDPPRILMLKVHPDVAVRVAITARRRR
jgi:hypothetical protein